MATISLDFFGTAILGPIETNIGGSGKPIVWPTWNPTSWRAIDNYGGVPVDSVLGAFSYLQGVSAWSSVELSDGTYDWSLFDLVWSKLVAQGVTSVLMSMEATPQWASIGNAYSFSCTINVATAGVVTAAGNNFQNGWRVFFSGGTVPGGLALGNAVLGVPKFYYVINTGVAGAGTFNLSATSGGPAITTTGSAGTSTITAQDSPPANMAKLTAWVTSYLTRAAADGLSIKFVEGPNEANNGVAFFVGSIAELVTMQQTIYNAAKAYDSTIKVLPPPVNSIGSGGTNAPGTANGGSTYLAAFLAAGGGSYCDTMSFHGYPTDTPTNSPATYAAALASFISMLSANGQGAKPLWNTEYSGFSGVPATDETYLARTTFIDLCFGVARKYYYAYDSGFPSDILWSPPNVTPPNGALNVAGIAYQQLVNWLVGRTLVGALSTAGVIQSCSLSSPSGYQATAVWTSDGSTPSYPTPAWATQYRTLDGGFHSPGATITLGANPVLIEGTLFKFNLADGFSIPYQQPALTGAVLSLTAASAAKSTGKVSTSGKIPLQAAARARANVMALFRVVIPLQSRAPALAGARGAIVGKIAIASRGSAMSQARAMTAALQIVALFARSMAIGAARAATAGALALRASARSAGVARLGFAAAIPLSARAAARTAARAFVSNITAVNILAASSARSFGRATFAASTALRSTGKAVSRATSQFSLRIGLQTAARAVSAARASTTGKISLAASGQVTMHMLRGILTQVVFGLVQMSAASSGMGAGRAAPSGATALRTAAKSVTTGLAQFSNAVALRALSKALVAGRATTGVAGIFLQAVSRAVSAARATMVGKVPLAARTAATAAGQAVLAAAVRFSSRGSSTSSGVARFALTIGVSAQSAAKAVGRGALVAKTGLAAFSRGLAEGLGVPSSTVQFISRGPVSSRGYAIGSFATGMISRSSGQTQATGQPSGLLTITSTSSSESSSSSNLFAFTALLSVSAFGQSISNAVARIFAQPPWSFDRTVEFETDSRTRFAPPDDTDENPDMVVTAPALLEWPIGDPGRFLDYILDYSCWLRTGETIQASTWSVPPPVVASNPSILLGGRRVGIWLQGGISGNVYQVQNTIITSQGRTDVRTVNLPIGPH